MITYRADMTRQPQFEAKKSEQDESSNTSRGKKQSTLGMRLPADRIILDMLTKAAECGAPCPSNVALAEQAGYSDPSNASASIGRLKRLGKIIVNSNHHTRIITIVATGKTTRPTRRSA